MIHAFHGSCINKLQPAEKTLLKPTEPLLKTLTCSCEENQCVNSVVSVFITAEITVVSYDGTCSNPCTGNGIS